MSSFDGGSLSWRPLVTREGAQILGISPQRVMSDAAFIAAGVDESCVIEMGHGGLLLRCPASASRPLSWPESSPSRGNDNGTHYHANADGSIAERSTPAALAESK